MLRKICFLAFIATSLAFKSPVLIWSSSRGLSDLPQSYTGQTVESDQFSKSYLKPLTTKNNLVVFVQDRNQGEDKNNIQLLPPYKLSLQDLNEHADVYNPYSDGGAFKNIKSFMEDQFSLQIPSVVSPWTSLEKMIKDFEGKVHKVKDVTDLSNLKLDNSANLIIVTLKPVQGSSKEGETFADNDVKMAEVTKHLTKRGIQFTAMYTGKTASKSLGVQAGVSRKLQAAVDQFQCENCTFINVTCASRKAPLYFYMRSVQVFAETDQKKKNLTAKIVKLTDDGTTCDNDTAVLKLKTPTAIDGLDFKLVWNIMKDNISEYWNVTTNTVTVNWDKNTTKINTTAPMEISRMISPKDFSYHCSYFMIRHISNGTEANITLTFDGLQLQPFNVMDDKFSDGWDCVEFFTPGIWMSIVSVSVMIIIILYGLNMIASLKTMDRYDDPKGKTITVNVNE